MPDTDPKSDAPRVASLDQFRGYTVLGMFFVNFAGHFQAVPALFKHHNTYCSYADTIMPQFFFAVGYACRLTLLRRLKTHGSRAAYEHVVWRSLGLLLLGLVIHHLGGKYEAWDQLRGLTVGEFMNRGLRSRPFQTLVHIAVTSLWVLPVVARSWRVRVGFALFSGGLHLVLSHLFYYEWVHADPRGIDGGPLGFLTWAIPLLAGTLAHDVGGRPGSIAARFVLVGCVLMLIGYGLSCLGLALHSQPGANLQDTLAGAPFVKPPTDARGQLIEPATLWTMSQRAGSVSYLTFATGFALVVYALFVLVCDAGRVTLGMFRTLGSNALAAYILSDLVDSAVMPYAPRDAPLWYALVAFGVFLGINYVFLRFLERKKLFLRL